MPQCQNVHMRAIANNLCLPCPMFSLVQLFLLHLGLLNPPLLLPNYILLRLIRGYNTQRSRGAWDRILDAGSASFCSADPACTHVLTCSCTIFLDTHSHSPSCPIHHPCGRAAGVHRIIQPYPPESLTPRQALKPDPLPHTCAANRHGTLHQSAQ